MSWDVLIMSVPSSVTTVSDIPDDFVSELGPRAKVQSTIAALFPEIDLANPTWGILDGDGFSVEFNIGKDDPIASIMLHVRGSDAAIGVIRRIYENTDWRAVDMSTGEFIDLAQNSVGSLRQWQAYRDHTIESLRSQGRTVIVDPKLDGVRVDAVDVTDPGKKRKWWKFW